jgi:hypothetical protein
MDLHIESYRFRELAEFNGSLRKIKLFRLVILLAAVVNLGIVLIARPADGHPVAKWPDLLVVGVLFLFALVVPLIAATLPWMVLRKASLCVRIDESGVEVRGEAGCVAHPWSFYTRMKETRNLFILFAPDVTRAIFIPKRVFTEPGLQETFVELVRRNLPGTLLPIS